MALDDLKNIHRQYEKAASDTHDAFRQATMEMGKEAESIRQTTVNTQSEVKAENSAEATESTEATKSEKAAKGSSDE